MPPPPNKPPARGHSQKDVADRIARAQKLMAEQQLDCILITAEQDFTYFSGFQTQFWHSPTRPFFILIPSSGPPIPVLPSIAASTFKEKSSCPPGPIFSWPAPRPEDDGISLLVEVLQSSVPKKWGSLGVSTGHQSIMRMPAADFAKLEGLLKPQGRKFKDCSNLIQRVRSIKSEAEIDKIRFSCRAVSVGLHKLHEKMALLPPGELTERSAAKILRQGILEFGCDDVPYLVAISGNPGYKDIITGPTDRPLTKGDLFVIDVGARFDDYWCDFDRNWSIGQVPNDKVRAAHRLLWLTSEAGIKAALPGVKCSDVFKAMAKVLEDGGVDLGQNNVGRMGHGLGLQLTEWPSIHPDDHTLLEEGMVITIEPGIGMEDGTMLAHEENMVIRKGGVELLTERAPCYIPVVQACTPVTEVRYAEGVLTTRQLDRKDIHGCPRGEPQHADTTEIMMRIKAQLSEVAAFHKTWEGGVPTTPLVPLAPLAKELGLKQVWLKDEGNRSMGGENLKAFKGLGVSWAVERVRRAGGLKQGTTVATMTDGNHGRALAYVAQKMGIPCVVFVPGNMVPARREAIEKYGAKVIIVKGSYDDAIVVVRKEAEKNGWILVVDTAWKGYTDVPLDILVGYTTIFRETEEQLVEVKAEAPVTHVFLQAGVGGFSSAGVAAVHLSKSKSWAKDVKFVIVEPSDADCILENVRNPPAKDEELRFALGDTDSIMAGLNCGQPSILSWPIVRDLASGFVALGDTWPREAVRKLHGLGVVAGESGVAGVAGLQALMNLPSLAQERDRLGLGPDSVVLLISTEADTDPGLYQQILAEDPFMCPGRIANAKL